MRTCARGMSEDVRDEIEVCVPGGEAPSLDAPDGEDDVDGASADFFGARCKGRIGGWQCHEWAGFVV